MSGKAKLELQCGKSMLVDSDSVRLVLKGDDA